MTVPDNVTESHRGSGHEVACGWNRAPLLLQLLYVFWAVFAGVMAFLMIDLDSPLGKRSVWEAALQKDPAALAIFLGTVALVVGTGYGLLAWSLNGIRILITPEQVKVSIGPVPWPGARTISRESIAQLFVKENTSKDSYGRIILSYEVRMIDPAGKRTLFFKRVSRHQALYLERRLEEILQIEDQWVRGAHTGEI